MDIKERIKRLFHILFIPTSFKPLSFIILHENLFSIYRNLGYYRKKCRIFIYLRIVLEIAFVIACIYSYSVSLVLVNTKNTVFYFYINSFNSILIMLLAIYHSRTFEKLLLFIDGNHLYFENDSEYQNNMIKRDRLIRYGLITSNLLVFFGGSFYHLRNKMVKGAPVNVLFSINARISDCRTIYEYVSLYSILYVISEQVACVRRALSTKKVPAVHMEHKEIEIRQYDELSTVFANIIASSKLFNEMFGLQFLLMLASTTAYCIMFLYTMAFISAKGYRDLSSLIASILKLLTFFFLLVLLSRGAQVKQNNVKDLRRQLGKLLNNCVNDDEHYKATKSLLRLVSTRAMDTKTLGSIKVDMTLVPSFVMFVISYTVIALQFNNIV